MYADEEAVDRLQRKLELREDLVVLAEYEHHQTLLARAEARERMLSWVHPRDRVSPVSAARCATHTPCGHMSRKANPAHLLVPADPFAVDDF